MNLILRNKKNKKGMTQEAIVGTIIIVLVLALILSFLFRASILNWIYNLPSYDTPKEDEEIDLTNVEDQSSEGICPFMVARIINGEEISFCKDFEKSCVEKISSKLLWKEKKDGVKIEVDQIFNNVIGDIQNKKIIIYPEILNEDGSLYREVKNDLPDYKYLINLNGAYYLKGNFICRDEIVSEERGDFSCDVGKIDLKTNKIFIENKETNLLWNSDAERISFKQNGENYIGDILKSDAINIKDGFLTNPEFILIYSEIPSLDKLKLLDESFKLRGSNDLCKTKEQSEKDKIEREKLIKDMVDSGKSKSLTFVFGESSYPDVVDVYWDFKKDAPAVRVFLDKGKPTNLAVSAILNSFKSFSDFLKERNIDINSDESFFYTTLLLNSNSPDEFSEQLSNIFKQKEKTFYLEYNGKKYYGLAKTKLNNLLYGIDSAEELK